MKRTAQPRSFGNSASTTSSSWSSILLTTRYQPTFNASLGGEFYVSRGLSLLGGFGTDLSAVDAITATSVASNQINRLLLSFGAGSHGENGSLLIGAQAYYGFGHALAPNIYSTPLTLVPTPMQTYGLLLVIAGETNTKAIAGAVNTLKKL